MKNKMKLAQTALRILNNKTNAQWWMGSDKSVVDFVLGQLGLDMRNASNQEIKLALNQLVHQ